MSLQPKPTATMRHIFRAQRELQSYLKKPIDLQSIAELHSIPMDQREYDRIKRDIARELEEAQAKCQKRLDSLEVIWELERGKQPPEELLDSITWSDMAKKRISQDTNLKRQSSKDSRHSKTNGARTLSAES